MSHLNGNPEWLSARKQPPKPNSTVYGFFNPHLADSGVTVHIRPVIYHGPGRWSCAVTGHHLSERPVMYSPQMPYPPRQLVHEVMNADANVQREGYLVMVPDGKAIPEVYVPFPAY